MRPRLRGVSLVELMVALVIGAVVVVGTLTLFARSRANYRVAETLARLQEKGRYALATIGRDVELAGYYGFTSEPDAFRLVSGGRSFVVHAESDALRQSAAAVPGVLEGAHACGINYVVDLHVPVQGDDGTFSLGRSRTTSCEPYRKRFQAGADTLTVRRVTTRDVSAESGRLQVLATRTRSQTVHYIFADGLEPGEPDPSASVRNLVVRAYYVARDSVDRAGFPALRVKSLTRSAGAIRFDEDEVMPGIEDLQVQFGIRQRGSETYRYVHPGELDPLRADVVSARVWLRVRADEPEAGFTDERTYRYANTVYQPVGDVARFRRVVVSRTFAVRNRVSR